MKKVFAPALSLFFLQLTLLCAPIGLHAQVDPSIQWKEIETKEAYWLFDARQQEVAEYYIRQFQRAKDKVFPLFKEPPRKMTIVLVDNTDLANGSARVTPHPVISLFTVQPYAYSSIGEFRDYVHELLVHEYTHILNMEPVHGWMSPVYWVFGSVAHPNMILPRWYTEGLAVYTESLISGDGGRLSSQYLQGLARALSLEKRWDEFPLSDLNDFHPDWLGGARAYLFGGILWESIAREKGDGILYDFNQSYSRRVPFFLDGVIQSYLGVSYEEQLNKAYRYWEERSLEQIKLLSSAPQLTGEWVLGEKEATFTHPKISSDGLWMAHYKRDWRGAGHIELTLRHPKRGFRAYKAKTVIEGTSGRSLAWHPASTGFVYEKLGSWKTFNRFFDLYYYDLRTQKSQRLTRGGRAHTPCFSPLGKKLYFISNSNKGKILMEMDWLTQKSRPLYQSAVGDDIRFLSCGEDNQIYFVEQQKDQSPQLIRWNLEDKEKDQLLADWPVNFIRNTHLGLLFSSHRSGVENLYLLKPNKGVSPQGITNTLTRVLEGEIDPLDDGLYYSQITADGPKLFYLKGAQWESLPDTPPQVEPIVSFEKKKEPEVNPAEQIKAEAKDFSPWRYLYPNHWIPFLFVVDQGMIFQAITSAGDPLGINTLSLVGQWDTLTERAGASVTYLNRSTPLTMGVALSDTYNYFYPTDTTLNFTNASAIFSYRWPFLDNFQSTFRWNFSQLAFGPDLFIRQGPQLQISYSDIEQYAQGVSPHEGWRFQLGHREFLTDLSNEAYGETYAHLGTYWSSFTPRKHNFYLGFNGVYHPRLRNRFFAPSTLAGPFFNPQIINTTFLQRGYPTGVFLAANGMVNINAEYHFPLFNIFRGWTGPPVFLRNITGNIIFDATTLDGLYSDSVLDIDRRADMGRWFTGYGLELETNVNMGFHVPVAFTLGLYYGQDQQSFGGFTTFFNVRL
jgi:Tol biopolymer transport system component